MDKRKTNEIRGVPEAEVKQMLADYKSEGITATAEKQADGTYTIFLTFPDEP